MLQKDHIALAVNDRVLPFSFNDSAWTSGAVGFIVKSDEPNAQVGFRNLRVSEVTRAPAPRPTTTPTR